MPEVSRKRDWKVPNETILTLFCPGKWTDCTLSYLQVESSARRIICKNKPADSLADWGRALLDDFIPLLGLHVTKARRLEKTWSTPDWGRGAADRGNGKFVSSYSSAFAFTAENTDFENPGHLRPVEKSRTRMTLLGRRGPSEGTFK